MTDILLSPGEARPPIDADRRAFFRTALGAAAVTATGAAALVVGARVSAQTIADADILNAALQLEYLLAEFYNFAASGTGLAADQITGSGTAGAATGARKATLTDSVVAAFVPEIAAEKAGHVRALRTLLGTSVAAQPTIDLGTGATNAFSVAMRAAGVITGSGSTFDPYASDANFLLAAFLFEDLVVSAYLGSAAAIIDKTNLENAAGLLATSSYHASIIRTTLYTLGATDATLRTNADKISDLRDALDGGGTDDDQGISPVTVNAALQSNIVPTNPEGRVFARAFGTALNVLFLNSAQVTKGGFYPNGLNGTVTTSAAN